MMTDVFYGGVVSPLLRADAPDYLAKEAVRNISAGDSNIVSGFGETIHGDVIAGTYIPPAPIQITSVSPSLADVYFSGTLTINGVNFGAVQGDGYILFQGSIIEPLSWADTEITIHVDGQSTGIYAITVQNDAGQSHSYTSAIEFRSLMKYDGVFPAGSPVAGGGTATVQGLYLHIDDADTQITLGGEACNVTSQSATAIEFDIPAGTEGDAILVVMRGDGETLTIENAFRYYEEMPAVVHINLVSPALVDPSFASVIRVFGAGFGDTQGNGTIILNGVIQEATMWTDTRIQFIASPLPEGLYTIEVTNNEGQLHALDSAITYKLLMTYTGITPAGSVLSGGGTAVIQGTYLNVGIDDTQITLGGESCLITDQSDTAITFEIPENVAGDAALVITRDDGYELTIENAFLYYAEEVKIVSVSPNYADLSELPIITLTSLGGFGAAQGTSTVLLGGTELTIRSWADDIITCNLPGDYVPVEGGLTLNINLDSGQTVELAGAFNFFNLMTFKGVTPAGGLFSGGQAGVITGTFLAGSAGAPGIVFQRDLLKIPATVQQYGNTSINFTVPEGFTPGDVSISIERADNMSLKIQNAFRFYEETLPSTDPGAEFVVREEDGGPASYIISGEEKIPSFNLSADRTAYEEARNDPMNVAAGKLALGTNVKVRNELIEGSRTDAPADAVLDTAAPYGDPDDPFTPTFPLLVWEALRNVGTSALNLLKDVVIKIRGNDITGEYIPKDLTYEDEIARNTADKAKYKEGDHFLLHNEDLVGELIPATDKPGAPQDLSFSAVGDTYFTVSWGLSAGATRFLVYLGGVPVGYTTKTSMQFTRKIAGTTYSVAVSGLNAAGEGPLSAALLVTTNPAVSKGLRTPVRIPRSKLRQYTDEFVTHADEQEFIADGAKTWMDGLTATLYHWKLDLVNSVKDSLFDEYSTQIYGDPLAVKGRIDVTPSEDLMHIVGTGRNFDGVITVHKLLFETREIAPTDLFSFKGQFYKLSAISSNELFKEQETFLYFTAFKRNTPELDAGINQSILI